MAILKYFYSSKTKTFNPPSLQCHRGYWVEGLQQNSLASVKKAYDLGFKMSEFDIRITQDQHVILFHDDTIDDRKVSDMTLAEVQSHQAVDSFESVVQWLSKLEDGKYYLNVEIKSKFKWNRNLERKALDLILKYKVDSKVLISSFNPLSLYFFRRHCPRILRALLLTYENEKGNSALLKSQALNVLALPHFLHLDEKYWSVDRFKDLLKANIPIVLWTCNDLEKVRKYFFQGVYGVISDALKPDDVKNLKNRLELIH